MQSNLPSANNYHKNLYIEHNIKTKFKLFTFSRARSRPQNAISIVHAWEIHVSITTLTRTIAIIDFT